MPEIPYHYVAYIDESGDDGLKRVRPLDYHGSSEWMMLSAVVIKANRENEVESWVREIIGSLWRHGRNDIHFKDLSPNKKRVVCERMADLNARYFVVCSNKKNMKGYKNPFAQTIPSKNWFYCWMSRILLERVTDFVEWHSRKEYGESKKLRIEYSIRGGLSYSQMNAYYSWLKMKGPTENLVLPMGNLRWSVMESNLLKIYPHQERAGLQLADVVASAFFKAADTQNTGGSDPRFAKLLAPRMARYRDRSSALISGYGVKLLPGLKRAELTAEQQEIFAYYGYPKQWWDPDSSNHKRN